MVIIDEIEGVDGATEAQIQKTIRMQLTDCTIICASRVLKNIIDYDRVIVMEKGKILELDSPSNLLGDASSKFYLMCRKSGMYEYLYQLAGQKEYVLEEVYFSSFDFIFIFIFISIPFNSTLKY